MRNALMCHGIARSEDELATLAGCTAPEGTTGAGIVKALRSVAQEHPHCAPGILRESRADVAALRLRAALHGGHVAILCVDELDHWVVAFGLLGTNTVHVSDSADSELVKHYNWGELMARWRAPGRYPYYGVIV